MHVSLVMFKSDGTRRDFPITRERVVIGRKNTCELRIPLTSVSRQHCQVYLEDSQVRLRDLGSSNGTFHNNIRVQEAVLQPGDQIVIGPVVFTVVVNGQPAHIEPVTTVVGEGGVATVRPLVASGAAPVAPGDTFAPAMDDLDRGNGPMDTLAMSRGGVDDPFDAFSLDDAVSPDPKRNTASDSGKTLATGFDEKTSDSDDIELIFDDDD